MSPISSYLNRLAIGVAAVAIVSTTASVAVAGGWRASHDRHARIQGSGDLETRVLDLEGFDTIRVDGIAEIDVSIGDDFRVELEAEDNVIDHVDARVSRGRLIIDTDDIHDIDTDEGIRFTITMPALVEIRVDGVCTLTAEGLDNDETRVEVDGVGDIRLSGRTRSLDVDAGGVGEIDLEDLVAQYADVNVGGVGDVVVYVEKELDVDVHGIGSVTYHGDPERVRDDVGFFGDLVAAD